MDEGIAQNIRDAELIGADHSSSPMFFLRNLTSGLRKKQPAFTIVKSAEVRNLTGAAARQPALHAYQLAGRGWAREETRRRSCEKAEVVVRAEPACRDLILSIAAAHPAFLPPRYAVAWIANPRLTLRVANLPDILERRKRRRALDESPENVKGWNGGAALEKFSASPNRASIDRGSPH